MSRKGNCWDNAVAESFFATLEIELIEGADWQTRAEAQKRYFRLRRGVVQPPPQALQPGVPDAGGVRQAAWEATRASLPKAA